MQTNRKTGLLAAMQAEHTLLETLLASLSEEQMTRAGLIGDWSVKDILAHQTWWEQASISEVTRHEELDPGLNGEPWNTDRANALMVQNKRATPLADVLAEFHASYREIAEVVAGLSEAELADEALYDHLADNTFRHYAHHRQEIENALR